MFKQYFDVSEIDVKKETINAFQGILSRLPFGSYAMDYDSAFAQIDNPDFVYIRHRALDRRYYLFLTKIRNRYPQVKIILEIPTYPYKGELLASRTMWPFYFKDAFRRNRLKKIVDRIAILTDDNFIFGVPTLKIQNGILVDTIVPAELHKDTEEINLIAVSACLPVHGYERCIRGLADYYNKSGSGRKIVKFHLVGEGGELELYKSLVQKNHLEAYVIFYGKKTGRELDAIYDKADIAMGAFAFYKAGITISSTLKVKEYLAKGLPVVSGCYEDSFGKDDVDFYLGFANDDSTVDIAKVLRFYEDILKKYGSREVLRDKIRSYAKKKVDMSVVMKPVVDYITGEETK
ncbi:MAG: hypothetical protein K2I96_16755 [Lachnospiraceae bacterium]|nr:hypothetical protein [Lachnospiraceae bacterium]